MRWNATLIEGDVADAVAELKTRHNLLLYGCGELAYTLARAGLVDEIRLGVHPTVFRQGTRLFVGDEPVPLELVSATGFRSGFAELVYRPA
jgi:dihydrofolate reductase